MSALLLRRLLLAVAVGFHSPLDKNLVNYDRPATSAALFQRRDFGSADLEAHLAASPLPLAPSKLDLCDRSFHGHSTLAVAKVALSAPDGSMVRPAGVCAPANLFSHELHAALRSKAFAVTVPLGSRRVFATAGRRVACSPPRPTPPPPQPSRAMPWMLPDLSSLPWCVAAYRRLGHSLSHLPDPSRRWPPRGCPAGRQ